MSENEAPARIFVYQKEPGLIMTRVQGDEERLPDDDVEYIRADVAEKEQEKVQLNYKKAMRSWDLAEFKNKGLRNHLREFVEREGACCPEDVGFDEYIKALEAENKRLREALEKLKQGFQDEYGHSDHEWSRIAIEALKGEQ